VYSTRVTAHVNASPAEVYRALLDENSIAKWRVPDGMTGHVHEYDAREGGRFRIALTYSAGEQHGKSTRHTDTYSGHFVRLVPGELVVEVSEFETTDPALRGEMTMTTRLTPTDTGTEVTIEHDGIPDAVSPADNEAGTRMALANLQALVESR
jgi:uncharacterized protein YndB with AHSA1/START domain